MLVCLAVFSSKDDSWYKMAHFTLFFCEIVEFFCYIYDFSFCRPFVFSLWENTKKKPSHPKQYWKWDTTDANETKHFTKSQQAMETNENEKLAAKEDLTTKHRNKKNTHTEKNVKVNKC